MRSRDMTLLTRMGQGARSTQDPEAAWVEVLVLSCACPVTWTISVHPENGPIVRVLL